MSDKLPKQWLHWAQTAGLRPEFRRSKWRGFYMRGRGRNWRVNVHGEFECSCPLAYFDRWANSFGASLDSIPKTRAQFLAAVHRLHAESMDAR